MVEEQIEMIKLNQLDACTNMACANRWHGLPRTLTTGLVCSGSHLYDEMGKSREYQA